MRIAFKIAYNGQHFDGYARQPGKTTVEGELISRLTTHGIIHDPRENQFRSASRTDKNVSALGNVIAITTSTSYEEIDKHLPALSTDSLIMYGIACVHQEFYPRHAQLRIYRYYLSKKNNDLSVLLSAAELFTGTHNFKNFARLDPGKTPIRTINNILISTYDRFYVIDFYAQTFLWNQIRRIISAIQRLSSGKTTKEQILDALSNPTIRSDFGLAPPEPLFLKDVIYDFSFRYHPIMEKKLKTLERQILQRL
ncbi:MAG: tRNA pseudouridine(38-40) synthase TruA [Candidatus Thermoplasmatota archaeon]